jgi:hypothetical protein
MVLVFDVSVDGGVALVVLATGALKRLNWQSDIVTVF